MKVGDSKPKLLVLQDPYGANLSYADKAAFQAAGWDLIWRDVDGVALTSQPTWTITDEGSGVHRVKYVVPTGYYWVEPTKPSGVVLGGVIAPYSISPETWANQGLSYDDDSLGGLLQTAQGVPALISADDGDLGDIVWKDAWTSDVQTIPLGKISRFGYAYADLASGWTVSAGFRQTPNGSAVLSGAGAGNGITAAFVAAASGTYKVSWDVYPTAMDLAATDESQVWFLDVQIKHTASGRIITVGRWKVTVRWQRDTTP